MYNLVSRCAAESCCSSHKIYQGKITGGLDALFLVQLSSHMHTLLTWLTGSKENKFLAHTAFNLT